MGDIPRRIFPRERSRARKCELGLRCWLVRLRHAYVHAHEHVHVEGIVRRFFTDRLKYPR